MSDCAVTLQEHLERRASALALSRLSEIVRLQDTSNYSQLHLTNLNENSCFDVYGPADATEMTFAINLSVNMSIFDQEDHAELDALVGEMYSVIVDILDEEVIFDGGGCARKKLISSLNGNRDTAVQSAATHVRSNISTDSNVISIGEGCASPELVVSPPTRDELVEILSMSMAHTIMEEVTSTRHWVELEDTMTLSPPGLWTTLARWSGVVFAALLVCIILIVMVRKR